MKKQLLKENMIRKNIGNKVFILTIGNELFECTLTYDITNKPFNDETPIFYYRDDKILHCIDFKYIKSIINR